MCVLVTDDPATSRVLSRFQITIYCFIHGVHCFLNTFSDLQKIRLTEVELYGVFFVGDVSHASMRMVLSTSDTMCAKLSVHMMSCVVCVMMMSHEMAESALLSVISSIM